MPGKKGFTLMEILVVLIIVGILLAFAFPNYLIFIQQGAAQAAQNNLTSIYTAEKNYYFTNGSWCTASCNSLTNINTTLSLNITDNNFTYTCNNSSGFTCTATSTSDSHLILTVSGGTASSPNPIVLPGGVGCTSSTGANPGCNPSCASDVTAYCPSN